MSQVCQNKYCFFFLRSVYLHTENEKMMTFQACMHRREEIRVKKTTMVSNKIFWIIWCVFVVYSIFLAPKNTDTSISTGALVKRLLVGPWSGLDAYVISIFYLLGKKQAEK